MNRSIPTGVVVGNLGRRVVAALIDAAPMAIAGVVIARALSGGDLTSVDGALIIISVLVAGAFVGYQGWAYGNRGAGLGARLSRVRLVGSEDGQPIGWWRWLIRSLLFLVLLASVVGAILLVVFLLLNERRQGWHDRAVRAIVVQTESLPVDQRADPPHRTEAPLSSPGLPPGLRSSFAPNPEDLEPGTGDWKPVTASDPDPAWMPRLDTSAPSDEPHPRSAVRPARPINQGWIPLPTPSSVIEPTHRDHPSTEGGLEDQEGTRLTSPVGPPGQRRGHEGWYVRLDDGREVELSVTVLLGRNPQKAMDDDDVHLVPAGGDGRMISRTHVLIGTDARGVFVLDRGSTNGTALVTRGGGLEPCPAGVRMRVEEGTQVSYGNRWFTALRRPDPR
ncbi:MAG: RDD family protein [Arachnia sp.]